MSYHPKNAVISTGRSEQPRAPWLLEQVRIRCRVKHYSLRTEQAYLPWNRRSILANDRRHPRDMGAAEVEAFLTMLATERKVSPSTHNQALSALLFLYREVLAIELPWLDNLQRPAYHRRIPSVLTKDEVATVQKRLKALGGIRPPVPKGIDPMRARPDRRAMRGR